jgi:hypothetical protein
MTGCFGLLDDHHHARIPGNRLVEANPRVDIWELHRSGALTEGALTEPTWGEKGCRLAAQAPNLLVDGNPILVVWDEPMAGVGRPWFECPLCKRRCRHLYLRQLVCRRCCLLNCSQRGIATSYYD